MAADDLEQFLQTGRPAAISGVDGAPAAGDDLDQFIQSGRSSQGFTQPAAPAPEPAAPERTVLSTAADIGITGLQTAVGVAETLTGLADIPTGGLAGKGLEAIGVKFQETQEILQAAKSPAQQAAERRVDEAEGFLNIAGTALENPSVIADVVAKSAGQLLIGGPAGRLITGLGKLTGIGISRIAAAAAGEGVAAAGAAAEGIRQQTEDGRLSLKQVGLTGAIGAGTAVFGRLGNKIGAKLGIADVDILAAGGDVLEAATRKGIARRTVEGAFVEGVLEELPQSVQEQILTNIALDKEDVFDGVDKAAALGVLAGGVMGAGVQVGGGTPQSVELQVRGRLLLEHKQRNPDFDIQGDQAQQFLAGALFLKEGEFTPAERVEPEAEVPAVEPTVTEPIEGQPVPVPEPLPEEALAPTTEFETEDAAQTFFENLPENVTKRLTKVGDKFIVGTGTEGVQDVGTEREELNALVQKQINITPETEFTDRERQLQETHSRFISGRLAVEARKAEVAPEVAPTPELVLRANGAPFATEASALRSQTGKRLAETHDIVPVEGGVAFQPKAEVAPEVTEPTAPAEGVTQEVQAETVPVPDQQVFRANGKPFASEASALRSATGKRLAETHEIIQVEGGVVFQPKPEFKRGDDPIQDLHTGLSSYLRTSVPQGTFTQAPAPKGQGELYSSLEKLLGKKIVFFKAKNSPMKFEGVTNISPDTIFVNVDSKTPHLVVTGHEFLHEYGRDSRVEYTEMKKTILGLIPKDVLDAQVAKLTRAQAREGQAPNRETVIRQAEDEIVADYFGDQFTKKEFWKKVEARNPEGFTKFVQGFIDFIEKIKGQFSGPQVTDIQKAQDVAAEALASFVRRNPDAAVEITGPITARRPEPLPEFVSVGIGGITPKPITGTLFREVDITGLTDLLRGTLANTPERGDTTPTFVTDDETLAIGQHGNRGILVKLDGDLVSGKEHKKPGTGIIGGVEFQTDFIGRDAITEFTLSKGVKLKGLGRVFARQQFDSRQLDTGETVFTRKGLEPSFKRPEVAAKAMNKQTTEMLSNVSKSVKSLLSPKAKFSQHLSKVLAVTPLPTLVEFGSKKVPQLKEYARLIRAEEQVSSEIISESYGLVQDAVEFAKKSGAGVEGLHNVMMLGTDYQMNPWASELDQFWVQTKGTASEQLAAAQELWVEKNMEQLTGKTYAQAYKEASTAYNDLKDARTKQAYRDIIEDVQNLRGREKNAMQTMIEDLTRPAEDASDITKKGLATQRRNMLRQMNESFRSLGGAYLPISRFGKWTASYTDALGNKAFEKFETSRAAEEFKAELEATGTPVSIGTQQDAGKSVAAIPREFLIEIQKTLEAQFMEGVDQKDASAVEAAQATIDSALDQVNQLYLRWIPETAALKNSMLRKNVRGASKNMTRGYLKYMQTHASNVAYFEQGRKIEQLVKEVDEEVRTASKVEGADTRVEATILQDMKNRVATNRSNKINKTLQSINKFTSLWYLSSPSIALVQMSQLGILTYPKLAVQYGPVKAAKMMTKATSNAFMQKYGRAAMDSDDAVNEVFTFIHEQVTQKNRNSVEAEGKNLGDPLHSREDMLKRINSLKTPYQKELLALREGLARGIMDISFTHEVQRMAQGADPESTVNKVQNWMMVWMQSSELASRKAAILSTFNLETDGGKGGNFFTAMDRATEVVDETLFDYSPAAKGTLLQTGPARTLLMFKHFQMMMTLRQISLFKNIIKGGTKAERTAATKEFIGIMGTTATLAGVRGLPIWFIWAAVDAGLGDEDEPVDSQLVFSNWVRDVAGEEAGKVAEFGLPALFNINISGRVGSENIGKIGLDSPEGMHGRGLAANYATQLMGPAFGLAEGLVVGWDEMMNKGEYLRGLEAVLPKPFKDTLKAYRFATDGVKTRGGKRLLDQENIGLGEIILTSLGFPPEEVLRASEREFKKRNLSTRISERRGALIRGFLKGQEAGDTTDAIEDIVAFNQRLPAFAVSGSDLRPAFARMLKGDLMIKSRRDLLLDRQFGE